MTKENDKGSGHGLIWDTILAWLLQTIENISQSPHPDMILLSPEYEPISLLTCLWFLIQVNLYWCQRKTDCG